MQRMLRILCVLIALCMPLSSLASSLPEPTIDPNAAAYDPEHPEDLAPDQLAAVSAILIEASTGLVIFEKDADRLMFPASTTKIMTVLLGIMYGNLDDTVTISATAVAEGNSEDGSSVIDLREGEEVVFRDLLYATMVRSGNDGASAIAEHVGGTIPNFVDLMNQAAQTYGMTNTHFANPHGLHNDTHYSTARDLATLAQIAMKNDVFRDIATTHSYNMPKTNLIAARSFKTGYEITNESSKYYYPYATGIKTGTTSAAGYCFVGSATKDNIELISVVLYSGRYNRWTDTRKLFEYGFSQYTSVTPVDLYDKNPIWVQTSDYSLEDTNMGKLDLNCVPADAYSNAVIVTTFDEVDRMAANLRNIVLIDYTRDFVAPIMAGEVMGTMTYFPEDRTPVVYNLVASRTVRQRENAPKTLAQIMAETDADPNPFPPLSLGLVLLFLSPLIAYGLILTVLHFLLKMVKKRHAKLPKNTYRYLK